MAFVDSLPYTTSLPTHFPKPTTFSSTPTQVTLLFPLPTQTLLRWLKPLPSMHQILRSGNNSLLPLEKTHCILGVTFDPDFKCQIYCHPALIPYQHLQGLCWYQLGPAKKKPNLSPICHSSDPFSCMQFLFGSRTLQHS